MSIKLKLNKSVVTSDTSPIVYTLKLSIAEAEGITPNIFVTRYMPGSRYTGPESYTFWNVAYADELTSVTEQPTNKYKSCEVRRSEFEHKFYNYDDLNDFIVTVLSDIQRLIKSVSYGDDYAARSEISITSDTATELPVVDDADIIINSTNQDNQSTVISLSFTGE